MKKKLITLIVIIFLPRLHFICIAQQPTNKNGNTITPWVANNSLDNESTEIGDLNQDSLIKARLVLLAVNNPLVREGDDKIKVAQIDLTKAKNSWLGSLNAAGNVNEFVINNTVVNGVSAANYYPKYNFGVMIPFDLFSKTKNDTKIARQNIDIAKADKEDVIKKIKKEVLTLYENYKEKKELLRLAKIAVEGDNQAYIAAQKSYSDGTIQLGDMNKTYQTYIITQSKMVTAQRDYNVSVVELENEIGVPVEDAISQALNPVQGK